MICTSTLNSGAMMRIEKVHLIESDVEHPHNGTNIMIVHVQTANIMTSSLSAKKLLVLHLFFVRTGLVGVDIRADTAALDRDREKYSCHSLQRHTRCDEAGARTTFDGPKTLPPSLLPWLADAASAGRASYFFSFRLFAGASTHSSWPLGQVTFRSRLSHFSRHSRQCQRELVMATGCFSSCSDSCFSLG